MNGDKPESDDIKTAEDLLDAISETWADRTGIVGQLKSIPSNLPTEEMRQRHDDLILRWVKNAYREGLYEGRMSLSAKQAAFEGMKLALINCEETLRIFFSNSGYSEVFESVKMANAALALAEATQLQDAARPLGASGNVLRVQHGDAPSPCNTAWQPIETAPKDGTTILAYPCYSNPKAFVVQWREGSRKNGWATYLGICPIQPLYWMHLPEPPALAEAEGER